MMAFMIIKDNIICWHFLKALPSAKYFHCILRAITANFWDKVFSLRIWGHFIQQCTSIKALQSFFNFNRLKNTQLGLFEKEELACVLHLIQIFVANWDNVRPCPKLIRMLQLCNEVRAGKKCQVLDFPMDYGRPMKPFLCKPERACSDFDCLSFVIKGGDWDFNLNLGCNESGI